MGAGGRRTDGRSTSADSYQREREEGLVRERRMCGRLWQIMKEAGWLCTTPTRRQSIVTDSKVEREIVKLFGFVSNNRLMVM